MAKKGSLSINSENIFPIIKKWLYSDHDIFMRELISNGCDAITKLKKLSMIGEFEEPENNEYKIEVRVNQEEKTIKDLTVDEIMRTVAQFYGVKMDEILSKERTQTLVTPRQVAMFLSCKLTTRSLVEIGRAFEKTHATVYHGAQTIQKRIDVESDLRKTVENITSQLGRNPSELTK